MPRASLHTAINMPSSLRQLNKSFQTRELLVACIFPSSHTHHVAPIYRMSLKATKVNCCGAKAVRTCWRNNLAAGSDGSGRNMYDTDVRRIQCVPFIVSPGMAAVAGCPGARDKPAELGAEIKFKTPLKEVQ